MRESRIRGCRRVARQIGSAPRRDALVQRDLQRFRVFVPRRRGFVARQAQVAKVETARELGDEIARLRDLPLHLLDFEIGRDARLRHHDHGREEDRHDAKYPFRALRISTPRRRGSMRIARQPLGFPWL